MQLQMQVLGVACTADDDAIRRAKRNLVLVTHPDKTLSPGARQAFERVTAAHDLLSIAWQREQYVRDMAHAAAAARQAAAEAQQRREAQAQAQHTAAETGTNGATGSSAQPGSPQDFWVRTSSEHASKVVCKALGC